MQIKPHDGALATTSASVRPSAGSLRPGLLSLPPPADVTQLTGRSAPEGDTVSLSNAVLRLASALREALPELDGSRIAALLTTHDRFVLARALELAQREQIDPKQVQALLHDLAAYRSGERSPENRERSGAHEPPAREGRPPVAQRQRELESPERRLSLPVFSARDEQLARQILQSQALQDTAIDQGFVRALVDPDRHPTHEIDFEFLRRLVVALSPGQSEEIDPRVSLAPRLARGNLADAIMRLELRAGDLPAATPEVLTRGRALLQQSLAARHAAAGQEGERPMFWQLRSGDRALLSLLHVAAEQQKLEPRALERVTHALVALRWAERGQAAPTRTLASSIPPPRTAASTLPSTAPAARLSFAPAAPSTAPEARLRDAPASPSTAPEPRLSYPPVNVASSPGARESFAPSASTLQHERELSASLRSRTASLLAPGAHQPSSAPSGASPSAMPPTSAADAADSGSLPPAARSFGSVSQLAARAAGSYASLAPPPLDPTAMSAANAVERGASFRPPEPSTASPHLAGTSARGFDLSQALGVGALLEQARGRRPRAPARPLDRPQERAVHAVTYAQKSASEAEADDPLLSASRRERRRVRWQLLIQRRKQRRGARD